MPCLLGAPDCGDHPRTPRRGELHARGAEPTRGTRHEHRLTGAYLPAADDRVVCRVRGDEERGRLDIVERVGRGSDARSDGDRDVGETAPWLDAHADDARPDEVRKRWGGLAHDPDALLSRDVRVGDRDGVRTACHGHVGERERGGAHVEDRELRRDLVRSLGERDPAAHAHAHLREAGRRGLVDVLEDEYGFGFADVVHPPSAHHDPPTGRDGP